VDFLGKAIWCFCSLNVGGWGLLKLFQDDGVYVADGDGWRNYDSDGDIDANDDNIVLKFYTRPDTFRTALGDWVETNLEALNIQV